MRGLEKEWLKSKKFVVIAIAGALLLMLVLALYAYQQYQAPERVITRYLEAVNQKDYERMYALISPESQEKYTKDAFIERNKNIYEGVEAKNLTLDKVYFSEKVPYGEEILSCDWTMDTLVGPIKNSHFILFTKENFLSPNRIIWDSSMIFSMLKDGDKVNVVSKEAPRGTLFDRNGNPLATMGAVKIIALEPGKMNAETKDGDIAQLASLLAITPGDIQGALSAGWVTDDAFVPIKTLASVDAELTHALFAIPGVLIEDDSARTYPYGEKAAHLVGYVQGISAEELAEKEDEGYSESSQIGKTGLERLYEDRLKGEAGATITVGVTQSDGSISTQVIGSKSPVRGEDVKTTIDASLQTALYDQLTGDKGTSVALNPKTGEVLALVSTPSYDPSAFVQGMSEEAWQAISTDPATPLQNRFEATYTPGSTFKPITGAIGLKTGVFTADEDFGPSGRVWQKDAGWGDFNITTLQEYPGPANLENALVYSDNIYFAKAALKVGGESFAKELTALGFGERLPVGLDMIPSGISQSGTFQNEGQLAASGFGQGEILVNPLHLATIYTAFTGDGSMVKPVLEYADDTQAEYWKPQALDSAISETIRNDLIQVVENPEGTGHDAQIEGLSIAGKTGTAEIKASQADATGTELGWFAAFTADPAVARPLMVVSMVEDVKDRGGSHYVVPKVKAVMEGYR
ncbi:penicillin-binding transpeptidase domain-containing protein [Eubacterium barkeri]|uniref:Penicillin-binding protein n=1 Tax=Eubacterium barkeri TaxID=1528 RepID=A0A1H3APY7_EUBBA|nr:penicillin-binding transpeptidase domain-containing protein [Eubacterium barkeri]SDX31767.1 penicillin-binding protein [Eubacterium barkeri]